MWAYVLRKLLYNIPVYMGVILFLMILLRLTDPVTAYLGKFPTYDEYKTKRTDFGLDRPLLGDWQVGGREWTRRDGGVGGSHLAKGRGTGKSWVQWTLNLEPGQYDLFVSWPGEIDDQGIERSLGESGLVWVRLLNGSADGGEPTAIRTASVDQTRPADDAVVDGVGWATLGSVRVGTDPLIVRLLDDSSGGVLADALRVVPEAAGEGGAGDTIVLDAGEDAAGVEMQSDPWTFGGFVASFWDNQYRRKLWSIIRFDFEQRSWAVQSQKVGEIIASSIVPSMSVTLPVLLMSTSISVCVGLFASFNRGKPIDRGVMFVAVLGMSISYLVYVIVGQYIGAAWPDKAFGIEFFATFGYDPVFPAWGEVQEELQRKGVEDPSVVRTTLSWVNTAGYNWRHFCLLPVIIGVIVAMGYDTRFYRAVMVEECNKDYIRTARAKGASNRRVMFRHMLRNALIPIITRVMISLPFVIMGSLLVEIYFGIPGLGQQLYTAITAKDFPVVEAITALLAALFIITNILTDVLYAIVDPRVTLK
ncbi:MAG: ABC transporter permease subunit [Planctomycetota bacterium]